jgi:hypothetical protein
VAGSLSFKNRRAIALRFNAAVSGITGSRSGVNPKSWFIGPSARCDSRFWFCMMSIEDWFFIV